MPIKFEDEDEGKVLAIQISGKLTTADCVYFAPEFERLVQLNGNMRVLFDLTRLRLCVAAFVTFQ